MPRVTFVSWSKVEADFRVAGFLAPSAERFRDHFKSAMAHWFSVAERLNALGQRMYVECSDLLPGKPLIDPTSLALQMMPRCLNAFQATIILAERGMGIEAQTHVRNLFETAFWMGYVGRKPSSAIPQLRRDTLTGEISLFEASLRHLKAIDVETRAEIVQKISEMKIEKERHPKVPSVEEIAVSAEYGPMYFFYKELSGAATHISFKSIYGFLNHDQNGEVVGHQIGPDEENTGKAIWLGCRGMALAIDALGRAPECSQYDAELMVLNEEIKVLEPYRPLLA